MMLTIHLNLRYHRKNDLNELWQNLAKNVKNSENHDIAIAEADCSNKTGLCSGIHVCIMHFTSASYV